MNTAVKVLLVCPSSGNPYISELVRYLNDREDVICVQSNTEFLSSENLEYDVVHLQWPEAIFGWNTAISEQEVLFLEKRLEYCLRAGIRVVLTVHNAAPHTRRDGCYSLLYETIYRYSDAFVHLGRASLLQFKNEDPNTANVRNFVIPHGNYNFFKEVEVSEEPILSISDQYRVLCFGAVRKLSEIRVICEVADLISKFGGEMILAGRIFSGSRRKMLYYKMRYPLYFRKNIRLIEGKIPDSKVASLVSSCDSVLIPRVDTLNSGNVMLGFTFGKVVLGPNIGNIGMELEKLSNPTFDPSDLSSLRGAVVEMRNLADSDRGNNNRIYSDTVLSWGNVAKLHFEMYRSLQQS